MGGSFHSVLVNIIFIPNCRAQEFKVAANFAGTISGPKERIRELHMKPSQVDRPDGNKVALAQIELETDGSSTVLDKMKSLADGCDISSQHTIVKVVDCDIQPALAQIGGQGLQGSGKKQWAKGITLLDTALGLQGTVCKLQPGGGSTR